MTRRFIFVVLSIATASATLSQNIRPAPTETSGPRPIARTEGRRILAAIPVVDIESQSETDCSHLVHDIYEQAGFPYDYITSRELYIGSAHFTRVHLPQAGDLVVWRGHVGIVVDPKQHSFFSFVSSGPDTQFYDSPYWRSRGVARFFRYVTEKPIHAGRTLEAEGHPNRRVLQGDDRSAHNDQPPEVSKPVAERASHPVPPAETSSPIAVETPRQIVFQAAGKSPSPEEIAAAFVKMNQDSGEALRTGNLTDPGKSIVIYRELYVSAVQTKGKHGTALVQIESLAGSADARTESQHRWTEQSLEFEKRKTGWVMTPINDAAYIKREIALQALSSRLADLAKNINASPEQEHEQRQIIRLLNLLVTVNSSTASAQSN
jgi:hypothetical protein